MSLGTVDTPDRSPKTLTVARCSALLKKAKVYPGLVSFLITSLIVLFLCFYFQPRWESNDDVFMSMTANGYGAATTSSPNLIYSNVIWGYITMHFPHSHKILGYSIAMGFVLFLSAWMIFFSLLRFGLGHLIASLAVFLVFGRALVYPQFTTTAGLLTVASVLGLRTYATRGGRWLLAGAFVLAWLGFLIRNTETILVMALALPFLPWKALWQSRKLQIAVAGLGLVFLLSWAIDRHVYRGPEWQRFREFNSIRIPYTDYEAVAHLKKRPDIMARYGYSENDLELIRNWFFADPKICNPEALRAMLKEVGPLYSQSWESTKKNIIEGIKALAAPRLLPLLVSALILFLFTPKWRVGLGWALCLAAICILGVAGRPGILRVYFPLISLLVLAPLAAIRFAYHFNFAIYFTMLRKTLDELAPPSADSDPILNYGKETPASKPVTAISLRLTGLFPILIVLSVAGVWNFCLLSGEQRESDQTIYNTRQAATKYINDRTICWGAAFSYENAFPVYSGKAKLRRIPLYSIAPFSFAPYSVAIAREKAGQSLYDLLLSGKTIPLIADPQEIKLLTQYCAEHFGATLHIEQGDPKEVLLLNYVHCVFDGAK